MNERPLTAEDIEAMARAGGLTVSELCALADVSRTSFYRWKRGEGGVLHNAYLRLVAVVTGEAAE